MLSRFTELLWHYFPELGSAIPGLARPLVKNTETEHVTIVNSEHVPDQDAVREWVSTFGTMEVSASNLKHTVSLDWARFSVCLVVGLEIAKLADFIDAYNKEFGTKARVPSAHITVAIDPRTDAQ